MKANVIWKDGMEFDGLVDSHTISMDAKSPIGKNKAATPKELVALGLGGCTAMDVIALMKKYKQPLKKLNVGVEVHSSTGAHPVIFEKALLTFNVEGDIEVERLIEAVQLSQTKYCGISAMLSKALPIEYEVLLNGIKVGAGIAKFET